MVQMFGMIQCGGCLRFTLESLQGVAVSGQLLGEKLEGDGAFQLGILGAVDLTHAALTELFRDAVVRDGLASHFSLNRFNPARASTTCGSFVGGFSKWARNSS
jgi:hypothetical protein